MSGDILSVKYDFWLHPHQYPRTVRRFADGCLARSGLSPIQYLWYVASGAKTARPDLNKLLSLLQAGDTLIVWKLDRLGRSLGHLIETVELLCKQGVWFQSLQEGFDTTTAGGKLIFNIFGAIAEFERSLIRERTNAGLKAARARGRVGGRPKLMDREKVLRARELHGSNTISPKEIAQMMGVSVPTLYRYLQNG